MIQQLWILKNIPKLLEMAQQMKIINIGKMLSGK